MAVPLSLLTQVATVGARAVGRVLKPTKRKNIIITPYGVYKRVPIFRKRRKVIRLPAVVRRQIEESTKLNETLRMMLLIKAMEK